MASTSQDFYVTLPSNSSFEYFPDNTASNFRTHLRRPIDLEGDWEVGLVEFHYPNSWDNVPKGFVPFKVRNTKTGTSVGMQLHHGYYPSNNYLFDFLNRELFKLDRKVFTRATFDYRTVDRRVKVSIPNGYELILGEEFRQMAGFKSTPDDSPRILKRGSGRGRESEYAANIHRNLAKFYIYTDIIEENTVGHGEHPLLRDVPIKAQSTAELTGHTFDKVYYFPLNKKYFNNIHVYIADHTGDTVSFQRGITTVRLHFRQRRPSYL